MADVPTVSSDFLTQKKGGLPIWGWAAIVLVLAYAYNRYKNKTSGTSTTTTDTASQAYQVPDYVNETNITNVEPPVVSPTPKPPVVTPPGSTSPPVVPPPRSPRPTPSPKTKLIEYRVKKGDSLSSIAKKYNTTWQAIWHYNTTPGNRPASTIKTLKERGPNKLYSNELIDILVPA